MNDIQFFSFSSQNPFIPPHLVENSSHSDYDEELAQMSDYEDGLDQTMVKFARSILASSQESSSLRDEEMAFEGDRQISWMVEKSASQRASDGNCENASRSASVYMGYDDESFDLSSSLATRALFLSDQTSEGQEKTGDSLYRRLWLEAEKSRRYHLLPLNQKGSSFLLFSPNGRAYYSQQLVGEGGFKCTYAVQEVAVNYHFLSKLPPSRAVSLSKKPLKQQVKGVQTNSVDTNQLENPSTNEAKILAYLKYQSLSKNLSHVNLSDEEFRFYYRTGHTELEGESVDRSAPKCDFLRQSYEGSFAELFNGNINELIGSQSAIMLTEENRLTLICGIAKGVAQLHAVGVIHRDIKPDNVLYVMTYPIQDIVKVKITDFGHSSLMDLQNRHAMCSPHVLYMDPSWHQIQGWKNTFSPASDVYQLGLIAFQILLNYSMQDLEALFQDFAGEKDFTAAIGYAHNGKHAACLAWKQQPETWKALEEEIADGEVKHMILSMLSLSQDLRPSADQVVKFFERKLADLEEKGSIYRETSIFNED
ncbi:protein kinase domain-containing protein [Candidatus Protochlamydia phocaeensis]|uniref:protein kinase domain-containing protein n=1 Tax=Candidatus Protochlamydia phocaeensis TaxID=1414722 RepID=UPI000838598E|nr:protein kinase [Candidatus Protochlamydia phocaeensis]